MGIDPPGKSLRDSNDDDPSVAANINNENLPIESVLIYSDLEISGDPPGEEAALVPWNPPAEELVDDDSEPCEEHYRVPKAELDHHQHGHPDHHVDHPNHDLVVRRCPPCPPCNHYFIAVKQPHRFLLLYTFLKEHAHQTVALCFATTQSALFYSALLQRLKFPTVCLAHDHHTHQLSPSSIPCLTNATLSRLPHSPAWLLQLEPLSRLTDYLTATANASPYRALLFLTTPQEYPLLSYFAAQHVPLQEYQLAKLASVQLPLEKLMDKDKRLRKMGEDAFQAYWNYYTQHHWKEVYDVGTLDRAKVAKCFGLVLEEQEEAYSEEETRRSKSAPPLWKPVKSQQGNTWMTKEKTWRHADRHASSKIISGIPKIP